MNATIYFAMVVMLITGTANTILMSFQTDQERPLYPGGKPMPFDHPYIQTMFMMIGELGCLAIFYTCVAKRSKGGKVEGSALSWSQKFLFLLPVMCDITATTMVNMAYLRLPPSVIQMTRGMIVFFTCLFSVLFLGRRQERYHLVGVFFVCTGITLVGYSQLEGLHSEAAFHSVMIGITLCVGAQAFQASMLVIEEKVLHSFTVAPLEAIGLEGFFGCLLLSFIIPFLCLTGQESVQQAAYQMSQSVPLTVAIVASMFSIAFFNWSGITVTAEASAVWRSTIDCSRTILVWVLELSFGWNKFNSLQLLGFIVLAAGTMLYNKILPVPAFLDASGDAVADRGVTADELEALAGAGIMRRSSDGDGDETSSTLSQFATDETLLVEEPEKEMAVHTLKSMEGGGGISGLDEYNYGSLIHHEKIGIGAAWDSSDTHSEISSGSLGGYASSR